MCFINYKSLNSVFLFLEIGACLLYGIKDSNNFAFKGKDKLIEMNWSATVAFAVGAQSSFLEDETIQPYTNGKAEEQQR